MRGRTTTGRKRKRRLLTLLILVVSSGLATISLSTVPTSDAYTTALANARTTEGVRLVSKCNRLRSIKLHQRINYPLLHSTTAGNRMDPSLQADDLPSHSTAESSTGNSCPFSKPFKRYRIPLSSSKDSDKSASKPLLPFLRAMQRSAVRRKLETKHQNVKWLEGVRDGVQVVSLLYETAVLVLQDQIINECTVVLPDASTRVVRQWVDIFEWMTTMQQEDAVTTAGQTNAEFGTLEDISFVTLKRVEPSPTLLDPFVELNPDLIEKRTKSWVKRVLVDLGICPFTKSPIKSGQGLADVGVPVANIAYHSCLTGSPQNWLPLFADTWKAITEMIEAGPSGKNGISSILLAAPLFDDDFDAWAGPIFAILEATVVAAGAEDRLGVVCFHPLYATPDGSTFPGFGHMHSLPRLEQWIKETTAEGTESFDDGCSLSTSDIAAGGAWQRRTPHATINVLRAEQLAAAESRRNTPNLYSRNIMTLIKEVGLNALKDALDQERAMT